MTKREYAEEVCDYINARGYDTEIIDHARNNGSCVAITLKRGLGDVLPVFNISDENEDPVAFAEWILSTQPANIDTGILRDIMFNKKEVLRRCSYILVNRERNKIRTGLVRKPVNDTLEVQYRVDVTDVLPDGWVPFEQRHMIDLGICEDELYSQAYVNTVEKQPYVLKAMSELLGFDGMFDTPKMWVLSNDTNTYGAGVILYEGMKAVLDEIVGKDFVILPSSIHELIVIPPELVIDKEVIEGLIREVNTTAVNDEDFLSNRPYKLISDGELLEL